MQENEDQKNKNAAPEEANKSQGAVQITEEELRKSLDAVETLVKSSPDGRKKELFAKGGSGALTADESAELLKLMAGDLPAGLSATISKSLDAGSQSEGFQKAINVSDYLDDLHGSVTTSLKEVASHIEKSDTRAQEQIMVLAKGVLDIGRVEASNHAMLKSILEAIGGQQRQPARAPKAAQGVPPAGTQVMNKSFGGEGAGGQPQKISKSVALDLMGEMFQKSLNEGRNGLAHCGEPIDLASTNYESFNVLSPAMQNEVSSYYQNKLNGRAS